MLKNTSKGHNSELFASVDFHKEGMALLVSPQILRSRGLGQIDLARFVKTPEVRIEICEMKSSALGIEAMRLQKRRILASAEFLSCVFGKPVKLIVKVG